MERNWDLVRRILIEMEKRKEFEYLKSNEIKDFPENLVSYHMEIMQEAGLIEARFSMSFNLMEATALRLTWQGHEFLDSIRADTVWKQVKETALQKGIALTFDLVGRVAGNCAARFLGLPT